MISGDFVALACYKDLNIHKYETILMHVGNNVLNFYKRIRKLNEITCLNFPQRA